MSLVNKPAFVFTPTETAGLLADIGRDDAAAYAFFSDVEACLRAFNFVASEGCKKSLTKDVVGNFDGIVRAVAQLRSALYALPDEMTMLIDLQLLADGARRRLMADLVQLVEPLEDVAAAIVQIRDDVKDELASEQTRLENRLIVAIATIYRNRLNRKATADADSGFPKTLADILEYAGHRLPAVAAARSAVTPLRLRKLVGASSHTALRLSETV